MNAHQRRKERRRLERLIAHFGGREQVEMIADPRNYSRQLGKREALWRRMLNAQKTLRLLDNLTPQSR